ncbi:hypothetical protein [Actinoallomurus bryophytorum]|nr:hypothetical protein [Actinoallomurus bryophytorum]
MLIAVASSPGPPYGVIGLIVNACVSYARPDVRVVATAGETS